MFRVTKCKIGDNTCMLALFIQEQIKTFKSARLTVDLAAE